MADVFPSTGIVMVRMTAMTNLMRLTVLRRTAPAHSSDVMMEGGSFAVLLCSFLVILNFCITNIVLGVFMMGVTC